MDSGAEAYVATKIIAVASGKGGTGKTSVTAGLGCALASLGHTCLMVDADAGMQSLDMALGVFNYTAFDFADVARGNIALADAVAAVADYPTAAVLSAPPTAAGLDEDTMRHVAAAARGKYDFIIIDAPAGIGSGFRMAVRAADMGIVVATADPICLRTASRTADEITGCGVMYNRLVVNRVRPDLLKHGLPNIDDAIDTAGLSLIGIVPEDSRVILSGAHGLPVTKLRGPAAAAFRRIAMRLCGEEVPVDIRFK